MPSLSAAPGPTAMTVASGSGVLVTEVGRKMPEAVFCRQRQVSERHSSRLRAHDTYGVRLELLDQDAVEERHDGLDGLERSLGSLQNNRSALRDAARELCAYHWSDGGRTNC